MDSPVTAVDTSRGARIEATTPRGTISARFMIITASTNVLASDRIKFDKGPLPKRQLDAVMALKLGSLDHIALDLPGNPLGLQRDDLVFEKASGTRTAALLANISGTSLSVIEVGGKFGRELMTQGDLASVDFAVGWLTSLFGNNVKRAVQRTQSTRWNNEPWVQGAMSSASPGSQWARAALREPVRERIYFAGEATHETQWGTVGGAWESGERAADQVLRRLSGLPDLPPPKPEPEPVQPAPRAASAQAKPQPKPEPTSKSKSKPSGKSTGKSSKSSRRRTVE
jgi:monoamine oxidase